MTAPPDPPRQPLLTDKRVQLLESMNEIEEMDDDSEEIHSNGLLHQYVQRPACLENVTLADWAALYDSCHKSFTKKSKSVNVDNPISLWRH